MIGLIKINIELSSKSNHSGKIIAISFFWFSVNVLGKFTIIFACKSPDSLYIFLLGIPSPRIIFQENGWVSSFSFALISTKCPSKWDYLFLKPSKASSSEIYTSLKRLSFTLLNLEWAYYFTVKITSPGIMSGICSASLSNITSSPSFIPFSTTIFNCLTSLTTFLPRQWGQLASLMFPFPPHLSH